MNNPYEEIKDRIKRLRTKKGITTAEMAKRLNISASDYAKAEFAGSFRAQQLLEIAAVLEIDPRYIFLGLENQSYIKDLTEEENHLIFEYRLLDKTEQKSIINILDALYYRKHKNPPNR